MTTPSKTAEAVERLKPCPFCGAQHANVARDGFDQGGEIFFVDCDSTDCDAQGPRRYSAADAIAAWNERTAQALTAPEPEEGETEVLEQNYREATRVALASPAPSRVEPVAWGDPVDVDLCWRRGEFVRAKVYEPARKLWRVYEGAEAVTIGLALTSPPDAQPRIEALEKALEPFADFAGFLALETEGFADADELVLSTFDHEMTRFKFGDFRRARAVLKAEEKG